MKTGILLINLGTPYAPTIRAVRKYLREFLSDPRVVELPRWLWLPILHGLIVWIRPFFSARKYQKIWTQQGSPLLFHTENQAKALQAEFQRSGLSQLRVAYAMRYGAPSIQQAINTLIAQDCQQFVVLPLYPQYAASCSASAIDAVYRTVMRMRNIPALYTVKAFHQHNGYIDAVANQIRQHWQQHGQAAHLVMSFHGIPIAMTEQGDPYFCQCQDTAKQLASVLGLNPDQYTVAFQSRFGKARWLQPSTEEVLTRLALAGIKSVEVVCPGFVADCLETLEEIAIEGKQLFESCGGNAYHYIPCLNTNQDWIKALADLCKQHLPGVVLDHEKHSTVVPSRE